MATTPTSIPTESPAITTPTITIHPLTSSSSPLEIPQIQSLFHTYALTLGIDLTYQDFATELATLPGRYAASQGGALFLARVSESGPIDNQASDTNDPNNHNNDPPPINNNDKNNNRQSYLGCVAMRALPLSLPLSLSLPLLSSSSSSFTTSTTTTSNEPFRACEMKRLYVTPEARSTGLGRLLARSAITDAKQQGYHAMYLDTLPSMTSAQRLYRSLGFVETEAYYETPVEGTVFMRLDLSKWRE